MAWRLRLQTKVACGFHQCLTEEMTPNLIRPHSRCQWIGRAADAFGQFSPAALRFGKGRLLGLQYFEEAPVHGIAPPRWITANKDHWLDHLGLFIHHHRTSRRTWVRGFHLRDCWVHFGVVFAGFDRRAGHPLHIRHLEIQKAVFFQERIEQRSAASLGQLACRSQNRPISTHQRRQGVGLLFLNDFEHQRMNLELRLRRLAAR